MRAGTRTAAATAIETETATVAVAAGAVETTNDEEATVQTGRANDTQRGWGRYKQGQKDANKGGET